MKLNNPPRLNADQTVMREMREHAVQVNALSEGRIAGHYNAIPSVPTSGDYVQGDFVRNSAPTELGTSGSKYVIHGWLHTDTGFVECRFLTGN